MRGPSGIDVSEVLRALLKVVDSAQDFEDEHEAWDMAPPSARPALVDVGTAFEALQTDLAKLRAILTKASDAYCGSMDRVSQQASGRRPIEPPPRISQRRRT